MAWFRRREDAPRAQPEQSSEARPFRQQAWRTAAPMQRVVEPLRLIAPTSGLTDHLASWHSPGFLAPLAHAVDGRGPSGHADGLVNVSDEPAPAEGQPDLPLPPTSRSDDAAGGGPALQRRLPTTQPSQPTAESTAGPTAEPTAGQAARATTEPDLAALADQLPQRTAHDPSDGSHRSAAPVASESAATPPSLPLVPAHRAESAAAPRSSSSVPVMRLVESGPVEQAPTPRPAVPVTDLTASSRLQGSWELPTSLPQLAASATAVPATPADGDDMRAPSSLAKSDPTAAETGRAASELPMALSRDPADLPRQGVGVLSAPAPSAASGDQAGGSATAPTAPPLPTSGRGDAPSVQRSAEPALPVVERPLSPPETSVSPASVQRAADADEPIQAAAAQDATAPVEEVAPAAFDAEPLTTPAPPLAPSGAPADGSDREEAELDLAPAPTSAASPTHAGGVVQRLTLAEAPSSTAPVGPIVARSSHAEVRVPTPSPAPALPSPSGPPPRNRPVLGEPLMLSRLPGNGPLDDGLGRRTSPGPSGRSFSHRADGGDRDGDDDIASIQRSDLPPMTWTRDADRPLPTAAAARPEPVVARQPSAQQPLAVAPPREVGTTRSPTVVQTMAASAMPATALASLVRPSSRLEFAATTTPPAQPDPVFAQLKVETSEMAASPAPAEPPSAPAESSSASPAPASAGGAGAPAAAGGGLSGGAVAAMTTADLEELTRRLFDPLSTRLKSELRLERERAGAITDLHR